MTDPKRCADPRSGHATSRVPADPALRRQVTALRYRAFAAEDARDRSEFAPALAAAQAIVAEAKPVWPLVAAEALYLLGTTAMQGGSTQQGAATLREAAALAERAHHDYIAANSWMQLVYASAFEEREPERALEYATYADAALDRIGRPAEIEAMFLYFKGAALIEADRVTDAEVALRRALALAETQAPQYLPQATLGLGYLFEEQGRYADAVATYRRAITQLRAQDAAASAHTFHERLAVNLSLVGDGDEAEAIAREAVAIAERALPEANVDRWLVRTTLAQVLKNVGRSAEALVEIRAAREGVAKVLGPKSARYGEVLMLEGAVLLDREAFAAAAKVLARACELIAIDSEGSTQHAECQQNHAVALDGIGRPREALALAEAVTATYEALAPNTPSLASALVLRGALHGGLGRPAAAIADLERAIALFTTGQLDPGHAATAKAELARLLWRRDRARAKVLLAEAVAQFATAPASWAPGRREAEAWLRTGVPPR